MVPDRNRPMDFEIYSLQNVAALTPAGDQRIAVLPFYSASHRTARDDEWAYYTLQRRQRLYSNRQVQGGARTSYIGTECFLSITDSRQRAWTGEIRQLDIQAWCTNRDLPIQVSMGKGPTDFVLEGAAPLEAIRCISGPTYPRPSPAFGDTAWRLISHLSLNYLSLLDTNPASGAESLRDMLSCMPTSTIRPRGARSTACAISVIGRWSGACRSRADQLWPRSADRPGHRRCGLRGHGNIAARQRARAVFRPLRLVQFVHSVASQFTNAR